MPVGLGLCFGPAIVAWLVAEWKSAARLKPDDRR